MECHKLLLVTKKIDVLVEVIDGRALISGNVVQKTNLLFVSLEKHQSIVVFNVIKSPSNAVILGLS